MNEILRHLTNRAGGFCSPAFPVRDGFTPATLNPDNQALVTLMGLDRQDTDYFVHAIMRTLQLAPDLHAAFQEDVRSYDLSLYRPMLPQVSGNVLRNAGRVPAGVLRTAAEWPVVFSMTLTRQTDQLAVLRTGQTEVEVRTHPTADSVQVEWPEASGVTGTLDLTPAAWATMGSLVIDHEPVRFPHALLRQAAQNDQAESVLIRSGLLPAFQTTVSPLRAVALLAASLIMTHPARE